MRAVVQRVSKASVFVDGVTIGSINKGLLVLLGVGKNDTLKDGDYLAEKIVNLRIFPDNTDRMNLSLLDTGGSILVVSQFTLFGDCRKGRRPSYNDASDPENAEEHYEYFVKKVAALGATVETGKFQAMMNISLVNDGPVTILLDSKKMF